MKVKDFIKMLQKQKEDNAEIVFQNSDGSIFVDLSMMSWNNHSVLKLQFKEETKDYKAIENKFVEVAEEIMDRFNVTKAELKSIIADRVN